MSWVEKVLIAALAASIWRYKADFYFVKAPYQAGYFIQQLSHDLAQAADLLDGMIGS